MKSILFLFFAFVAATLTAATHRWTSPGIKTLRVEANGVVHSPPVITLGTDEYVDISFDELSHEFRHFYYRIEHCDATWKPTENLWESDYLTGNNGSYYVDDYEHSFNTSVLYTHYSLRIPNENISLRASGNYRVKFFTIDEGTDSIAAIAYFSVVNPMVAISVNVKTDTDIDINARHQQLDIRADISALGTLRPNEDVRIVVMQNRRTDNAVFAPRPTSVVSNNALIWSNNRALIFPAGNEYRKFEILDDTHAYLGVDLVRWFDPHYHATLYTDMPRSNYLYDEDFNGGYIVRNIDNQNNDTESDYMLVHFALQSTPLLKGEIYLNGDFTMQRFTPEHQMRYNPSSQSYEATLMLKQGYYNYQYLFVQDGKTGQTAPIEGDFYQTRNEYSIYVYFKRPEKRHEELVGFGTITDK